MVKKMGGVSVEEFLAFFSQPLVSGILRFLLLAILLWVALHLVGFFCRRVQRGLVQRESEAAAFLPFLRVVLKGLCWFLIVPQMIGLVPGLSSLMATLLASGGVLAVVVGIAAQDVLGDVLSGVLIAVFKPFRKGDVVRCLGSGVTGTVEEVNLRHTVLRTYENKRVLIPNGTMSKEVVENANFGDERILCVLFVGISYESDAERALTLLEEEALALPGYRDCRTEAEKAAGESEVAVRVEEFLDSAVQLRAAFRAENLAASFALKSELYLAVKRRFEAEGIEIAYPHLVVEQKSDT